MLTKHGKGIQLSQSYSDLFFLIFLGKKKIFIKTIQNPAHQMDLPTNQPKKGVKVLSNNVKSKT